MVDEDKNFTPDAEQDFVTADIGDPGAEKALKNKKSGAGAWLGYGALVFVLILVGAGVFLLHELRSQQESLGSGLDKGDKRVLDMQGQISRLEADLQTIHQQLVNVQTDTVTEKSDFEREIHQEDSALTAQLEALRTDFGRSIQHIQRQLNQTRGDIMVADAEYLLSVANQKLHLVGDVKAVIAMMEAADQRLHDSGDPAAFKVREALAEEINLLKGFTPRISSAFQQSCWSSRLKSKNSPCSCPMPTVRKRIISRRPRLSAPRPKRKTKAGRLLWWRV